MARVSSGLREGISLGVGRGRKAEGKYSLRMSARASVKAVESLGTGIAR